MKPIEFPGSNVDSCNSLENMGGDYCKEDNFYTMVLSKLYPNTEWVHNKQIPNSGYRFRPDWRCESLKIIVEYNGYRHYTESKVLLTDCEKKAAYKKLGYTLVEWPYWIQPDKNTIKTLFNKDLDIVYCGFHQGFCSKKCVLPADFCTLGVERFFYELCQFDIATIFRVLWSLGCKAEKYGFRQVYSLLLGEDGLHSTVGGDCYEDGRRCLWRQIGGFDPYVMADLGSSIEGVDSLTLLKQSFKVLDEEL